MSDPIDELAQQPPPRPPPIGAALEASLEKLAPTASRRPKRQWALVAIAGLAYAGVLLAVLGTRADLRGLPIAWLVAAGGAWLTGFALPCYLALVPAKGTMLPRWQPATAIAHGQRGVIVPGLGTIAR